MFFIKKLLNFVKDFVKIIFITFFLILGIDFLFGEKILKFIDPYVKETEFYDKRVRVWDEVFHHKFKKNVNMKSTGIEKNNRFCTNNFGFKSNCNSTKKNFFKFAFMGDSFTEGIGLNYENTFVGIFEKALGSEVANMGVSSYSPKLHLAKLNYYLNKDLLFDHVIIFLDISDYYDEAYYQLDNKLSVIHTKRDKRRIWLKENFPFTNFYMYVLKKIGKKPEIENKESGQIIFDESAKRKTFWLNKDIETTKINGKSLKKIHEETKFYVEQIYNILKERNIKFSLAIYPWPQNLFNTRNNSFYRDEWKNFCMLRCEYFFDFFKEFEKKLKNDTFENIYKKYYFWGDIHFNKTGNRLIGEKLIKDLKN